jgi:hypothetical protein
MSDIPTAGALISRFKHRLYCSANNLDVQEVDESDRHVRALIESYFDGRNGLPPLGDPNEYADAFERMYPLADVRADFIADMVKDKRPNYGHFLLAALMARDLLRVLFTPNFDDLPEQAAHALLDSSIVSPRRPVCVAHLQDPSVARRAFERDSWPLICKIHGDFRSDRLKNVRSELRQQDEEMRAVLLESCRRFGLVVCGYSGRDRSVMAVLTDALAIDRPFPGGLIWFYRPADPPATTVVNLLHAARDRGVDVEAIPVDNFIELAGALEKALTFPDRIRAWLGDRRPKPMITPAPLPQGTTRRYPILRLNALPILTMPAQALVLSERKACNLAEAHEAIRSRRARALVGRLANGQLVAVGHTEELRAALAPLRVDVTADLVDLPWPSVDIDNSALGLGLDALTLGLGRTEGLRHVLARRGHQVRVLHHDHPSLDRLRKTCGELMGNVPKTSLTWAEAVGLTIERRGTEWWALLVPEIWISPSPSGTPPSLLQIGDWRRKQQQEGALFVRDRLATRHNRETNAILDAWARLLCAGRGQREVRTWNLRPTDGIDPTFVLEGLTAFSRPLEDWRPPEAPAV